MAQRKQTEIFKVLITTQFVLRMSQCSFASNFAGLSILVIQDINRSNYILETK